MLERNSADQNNNKVTTRVKLFKQQKTIVKANSYFKETYKKENRQAVRLVIAKKQTKSNLDKEFMLKKFRFEEECIKEKLAYDLLDLCGVKVPKSYIVMDEKDKYTILASQIMPGYRDMLFWMGGYLDVRGGEKFAYLHDDIERSLSKQCVLAKYSLEKKSKPIVGLFENVAVFAFIQDYDAVGPSYQNVGLIEYCKYFQTIKIDPGFAFLDREYDSTEYALEQYLHNLTAEKFNSYYGDIGGNKEVFRNATRTQINHGMIRVAQLTDEQIYGVIFNVKIPESTCSIKYREEVYSVLIERRNAYRTALETLVPNYSEIDVSALSITASVDSEKQIQEVKSGTKSPFIKMVDGVVDFSKQHPYIEKIFISAAVVIAATLLVASFTTIFGLIPALLIFCATISFGLTGTLAPFVVPFGAFLGLSALGVGGTYIFNCVSSKEQENKDNLQKTSTANIIEAAPPSQHEEPTLKKDTVKDMRRPVSTENKSFFGWFKFFCCCKPVKNNLDNQPMPQLKIP